jgi:hypothetical protein
MQSTKLELVVNANIANSSASPCRTRRHCRRGDRMIDAAQSLLHCMSRVLALSHRSDLV